MMATETCTYCGRTLDLGELNEKEGTFSCRDEDACLDAQNPVESAIESGEVLSSKGKKLELIFRCKGMLDDAESMKAVIERFEQMTAWFKKLHELGVEIDPERNCDDYIHLIFIGENDVLREEGFEEPMERD